MNPLKLKFENYASIIHNFKYITALQAFNLLVPFIIYPYIIRVIGAEKYGLIIYAQSIIGYLVTIISFGFNVTATKEVSLNRNDPKKLSEIFTTTLILKSGLFIISVFLLLTYLIFSDQQENSFLFYITIYLCIYEWLFPFWYFNGIEKMKYITNISICSRILFLLLIFIFVKSQSDYLLYPIISALGCFFSIFVAFYIVIRKHNLLLIIPDFQTLKNNFIESTSIFLSSFVSKIYTNSNKVIVGSLLGMENLALYDLAEKFLITLKIPISSFSQAIFPSLSFSFNKKIVKKLIKYSIIITPIVSLFFILSTEKIITVYAGENMLGALNSSIILTLTLLPATLNNIFGAQILLTNGFNLSYLKSILFSVTFYVILVSFFYKFSLISINTLSYAILSTEIILLFIFIYYTTKHKLL